MPRSKCIRSLLLLDHILQIILMLENNKDNNEEQEQERTENWLFNSFHREGIDALLFTSQLNEIIAYICTQIRFPNPTALVEQFLSFKQQSRGDDIESAVNRFVSQLEDQNMDVLVPYNEKMNIKKEERKVLWNV